MIVTVDEDFAPEGVPVLYQLRTHRTRLPNNKGLGYWKYCKCNSYGTVTAEFEAIRRVLLQSEGPIVLGINVEREWWRSWRRERLLISLLSQIRNIRDGINIALICFSKYRPSKDVLVHLSYYMPMCYGTSNRSLKRKLRKTSRVRLPWAVQYNPLLTSGRLEVRGKTAFGPVSGGWAKGVNTWGGPNYRTLLPQHMREYNIEHVSFYHGFGHDDVWEKPNVIIHNGVQLIRPSLGQLYSAHAAGDRFRNI